MSLQQIAALPRPLRFSLGLVVGAILYATLQPAAVVEHVVPWWCVMCGDKGRADFLLNVILFIPLGSVLRLTGARRRTAVLIGMFLSISIELTQAFIPGRDTTLGDVLSNTTGTFVGFAVAAFILTQARRQVRPAGPTALFIALALAVIALTGLALQPAYPPSIYYGQWTANLDGGLDWYRGHVLRATLGTTPLPSRQVDNQELVRALLGKGAPLDIAAVAGPAPSGLAPLFSIYDDAEREILMIAPRRNDLVIRFWTRSLGWRLDRPYTTLAGALSGVRPGDTLQVRWWRQDGRSCVMVNSRRDCNLGFTAGAGWSVLIYPESFGWWVHALLNAMWVGGILLPVGFFATSRNSLLAAGVAVALGLVMVPGAVGLSATAAWEWVGAALGIAGGVWGRR
ncbi:MAG TPA: VanZ family protein, partial [Gemmatimonadales bacterium]|nr:VanZ family protein [Gemmatimonadales bacterium]